jgi:hypothetical protein
MLARRTQDSQINRCRPADRETRLSLIAYRENRRSQTANFGARPQALEHRFNEGDPRFAQDLRSQWQRMANLRPTGFRP